MQSAHCLAAGVHLPGKELPHHPLPHCHSYVSFQIVHQNDSSGDVHAGRSTGLLPTALHSLPWCCLKSSLKLSSELISLQRCPSYSYLSKVPNSWGLSSVFCDGHKTSEPTDRPQGRGGETSPLLGGWEGAPSQHSGSGWIRLQPAVLATGRSGAELVPLLADLNANPQQSRTSHLKEIQKTTGFAANETFLIPFLLQAFLLSPFQEQERRRFWDTLYVSVA